MELRDLVVTPLLLVIIGIAAIVVRPLFTDEVNRKYFLPALWAKIVGALALGFIYQFYYSGGDTFAYHTHGSRVLWEAFIDSPFEGIRIAFSNGEYGPGLWEVADKIWFWRDPKSFTIIRIAFLFDLLTFSAYSGTAILFSLLSFIGGWMMFNTFYKLCPTQHLWIACGCLFFPSIIFWGSGILKDTITLAFLGAITFSVYKLFIEKKFSMGHKVLFLLSFFIIFSIKKYIIVAFLAAAFVWFFASNVSHIRSVAMKVLAFPLAIMLCLGLGYLTISKVVEDDPKYALGRIAETAKVTAYDIRYGWGARMGEGSGYTLGELDGTIGSMVKLAPKAINVSLFRPYFWEVNNPLMILSAAESLAILLLTLYVIFSVRLKLLEYLREPTILFCLIFSMIFAFGVGVSTYNFGTLARYKIPLLPYYLTALALIYDHWKRDKNVLELDSTE